MWNPMKALYTMHVREKKFTCSSDDLSTRIDIPNALWSVWNKNKPTYFSTNCKLTEYSIEQWLLNESSLTC